MIAEGSICIVFCLMIHRIVLDETQTKEGYGKEKSEKTEREPDNIVAKLLRLKKGLLTVSSALVKIQQEWLKEERRRKVERSRSTCA